MKYVGSKNRHAKEIISCINSIEKNNSIWVEPFVGGFNIIQHVKGRKRIGSDVHYYLIALFKAIQTGWEPPSVVTEDDYKFARLNKESLSPELVGFIGFGCSYAGKWFGGYARGVNNKGKERNYALESKNNLLRQRNLILNIEIYNLNYNELLLPDEHCIIYCDPPYNNTTKYSNNFDSNDFYKWLRKQKAIGHSIYLSEYNAPEDFKIIWEKEVNNTLVKNTGSKRGIEKLYTL